MTTAAGHKKMVSGVASGLGNYPEDRGPLHYVIVFVLPDARPPDVRTLISMKQAKAGGRGKSEAAYHSRNN